MQANIGIQNCLSFLSVPKHGGLFYIVNVGHGKFLHPLGMRFDSRCQFVGTDVGAIVSSVYSELLQTVHTSQNNAQATNTFTWTIQSVDMDVENAANSYTLKHVPTGGLLSAYDCHEGYGQITL